MPDDPDTRTTREERLAAKLRENLRRRKAQARASKGAQVGDTGDSGLSNPGTKS
ncbi:hypothetical protein V5F89_02675 [Pelagerythrobacter marensis]|uniref:DUF4169 domain-containing protein n=1 Tax=Pelagerythrobacter marensis TaxID=543877 RepID=A0ABZ2D4N7_9SPHN